MSYYKILEGRDCSKFCPIGRLLIVKWIIIIWYIYWKYTKIPKGLARFHVAIVFYIYTAGNICTRLAVLIPLIEFIWFSFNPLRHAKNNIAVITSGRWDGTTILTNEIIRMKRQAKGLQYSGSSLILLLIHCVIYYENF